MNNITVNQNSNTKIVSFASSKGGVGKSTSCAAVAATLALAGNRTLILDLDQNKTLFRWSAKIDLSSLAIDTVRPDDFTTQFRVALGQDYDYILIDLPGTREATMLKAIARSNLVIIPAQASEPDLREALVIVSDIRDVEEQMSEPIPFRLLLTKLYPLRTRVTDFAHDEIARHKLPHFKTALVERSAYREMFLNGRPPTICETARGAGPETAALVDEIKDVLGIQKTDCRVSNGCQMHGVGGRAW